MSKFGRRRKNATRQIRTMLGHELFVQMNALAFAGLALAERTNVPLLGSYRDHLKAALQNSMGGAGVPDTEASALIDAFIERAELLAGDLTVVMSPTAMQEGSTL